VPSKVTVGTNGPPGRDQKAAYDPVKTGVKYDTPSTVKLESKPLTKIVLASGWRVPERLPAMTAPDAVV
jgi:hypothetical protein